MKNPHRTKGTKTTRPRQRQHFVEEGEAASNKNKKNKNKKKNKNENENENENKNNKNNNTPLKTGRSMPPTHLVVVEDKGVVSPRAMIPPFQDLVTTPASQKTHDFFKDEVRPIPHQRDRVSPRPHQHARYATPVKPCPLRP